MRNNTVRNVTGTIWYGFERMKLRNDGEVGKESVKGMELGWALFILEREQSEGMGKSTSTTHPSLCGILPVGGQGQVQ